MFGIEINTYIDIMNNKTILENRFRWGSCNIYPLLKLYTQREIKETMERKIKDIGSKMSVNEGIDGEGKIIGSSSRIIVL